MKNTDGDPKGASIKNTSGNPKGAGIIEKLKNPRDITKIILTESCEMFL